MQLVATVTLKFRAEFGLNINPHASPLSPARCTQQQSYHASECHDACLTAQAGDTDDQIKLCWLKETAVP